MTHMDEPNYDIEHNLDCDIHFNMVYVTQQVMQKHYLKAKQT